MYVIVYRNDCRVIGGWSTEEDAERWLLNTPNDLFETDDEVAHADANSDYFIVKLELVGEK